MIDTVSQNKCKHILTLLSPDMAATYMVLFLPVIAPWKPDKCVCNNNENNTNIVVADII